jgi:choline dehydrogenase-like flavoprotein
VAGVPELRSGELEPLRRADIKASHLAVMAFHPLGTARADARADRGVVDGDLKLHDADNVYVSDASAVPSSIGVNPQITIMALAMRLAYKLLGKAAPDDEPHPETMADPRVAVHR